MTDLYVSTKGKDQAGQGSKAKSFKSISYTIQYIRNTKIADATKITVSPGIYRDTIIIQEGNKANLYPSIEILNADNKYVCKIDINNEKYTDTNRSVTIKPSKSNLGFSVFTINANNITLKGVHIDGEEKNTRGIEILGSKNIIIEGCKIENCKAPIHYTGEGIGTKMLPYKLNTRITDNGQGAGINIEKSDPVTIKYCVFKNNRVLEVYRVFLSKKRRALVKQRLLDNWSKFVAQAAKKYPGDKSIFKKRNLKKQLS